MCVPKFLVLLDTDKIKDYVFATNKLREIRGASAILDELNLESTYQTLNSDDFGEGNYDKVDGEWKHNCKTIKGNTINWEVMFLGGGSGKILFAEEERARKFCQTMQEMYREETDNAASITAVCVFRLDCEDFQHWIYRGEKELRKQKDSKYLRLQPLTNPYFKICESTGLLPAEEISYGKPICMASVYKCNEAKANRSYFAQFQSWLKKQNENLKSDWKKVICTPIVKDDGEANEEWEKLLPEYLSHIGSFSNGYVGFIYADGNRMGERLSGFKEPDEYRDFSDKVKDGTQEAIFKALAKHLGRDMKQNPEHIPFEILLLGGDDLMAVVPANRAIEIAKDFCEEFKRQTDVSICAGVLITHENYPIYSMMDHAEELLKSAKELSYKKHREAKNACKPKEEWEVNAIDFMVLKGALLQDVKEMRRSELSYNSDNPSKELDLKLYQRPYTIAKLDDLICWVRKFKESNFPHNKLKSMYEALYRGMSQAILDYVLITKRLPDSSVQNELTPKKVMMEFWKKWDRGLNLFPWKKKENEFSTPFLDLIELYDFVEKDKEASGE